MFMFIFIILLVLLICLLCGSISEIKKRGEKEDKKNQLIEDVKSKFLDRGYDSVEVQSCRETSQGIWDKIMSQRNYQIYIKANDESYTVKARDDGEIHEIEER